MDDEEFFERVIREFKEYPEALDLIFQAASDPDFLEKEFPAKFAHALEMIEYNEKLKKAREEELELQNKELTLWYRMAYDANRHWIDDKAAEIQEKLEEVEKNYRLVMDREIEKKWPEPVPEEYLGPPQREIESDRDKIPEHMAPTYEEEKEKWIPSWLLKVERAKRLKFLPFRMLGPELAAQFYNAPNNAGLVDRFFPPPLKTISRFAMVVSEPKLVRSLGKEKLQSVYGLHRQALYVVYMLYNLAISSCVPYKATLYTFGPHLEGTFRFQYGALLPAITPSNPMPVNEFPAEMFVEKIRTGWDISLLFFHFGWARVLGFPATHLFYCGINFPLPSIGISRIRTGLIRRDPDGLPHGLSRRQLRHELRAKLKQELFPLSPIMYDDSVDLNVDIIKLLKELIKIDEEEEEQLKKMEAEKAARSAGQQQATSETTATTSSPSENKTAN